MAHVFVSHAEEDQELALDIAAALERHGHSTWYYERNSVPGPTHQKQVSDAIDACNAFVLIASESSAQSPHVEREAVLACDLNKPFVPLLVGIPYARLRERYTTLAMCVGAAVAVTVPPGQHTGIATMVLRGLESLGIQPANAPAGLPSCGEPSSEQRVGPVADVERSPLSSARIHEHLRMKKRAFENLQALLAEQLQHGTPAQAQETILKMLRTRPCDKDAIHALDVLHGRQVALLGSPIFAVAVSPDGKWGAIGGGDKTVIVFSRDTGYAFSSFKGHTASVRSLVFSCDGRHLISGARSTGNLALSCDGRRPGNGSERADCAIRLWDIAEGKEKRGFNGHTSGVQCLSLSPGGDQLLSAGRDATVRLWNLLEGKETRRFDDYGGAVYSVCFAANGREAVSGDAEGQIRMFDVGTGTVLRRWQAHQGQANSVAFSPQGTIVASAGNDTRVSLWDVDSQREVLRFSGHDGPVRSVAFSPHGSCVATASYDGTVRLWDVDTGTQLQCYKGHLSRVECVTFAPDGNCILSCGWDGTVRSWQLPG